MNAKEAARLSAINSRVNYEKSITEELQDCRENIAQAVVEGKTTAYCGNFDRVLSRRNLKILASEGYKLENVYDVYDSTIVSWRHKQNDC